MGHVPPNHLGVVLTVPRAAREPRLLGRYIARRLDGNQILKKYHAALEFGGAWVAAARQVDRSPALPEVAPALRAGREDIMRRRQRPRGRPLDRRLQALPMSQPTTSRIPTLSKLRQIGVEADLREQRVRETIANPTDASPSPWTALPRRRSG
ncbi:hypothetical protein ACFL5O_08495 [Myxococcota bacterium]